MTWTIFNADARHVPLKDESVQCIVTSPPYWGLRDYGLKPSIWGGSSSCAHEWVNEQVYREMRRGINLANSAASTRGGAKKIATVPKQVFKHAFCLHCDAWEGCLGLEPNPALYLEHMKIVFREAWRVLGKDGTLWVNMGDSYTDSGRGKDIGSTLQGGNHGQRESRKVRVRESAGSGLAPKNLIGMPWRLAFALQDDGWTLRRDIIWHKTNPMPESAEDRPTTAHEYIFLLVKSRKYYYDGAAIAEPVSEDTHARYQKSHGKNSRMEVDLDPSHADRPTAWHNSPRYNEQAIDLPLGKKLSEAPSDVRASRSAAFGRGAGWRQDGVNPKAAPAGSGIRANESFSHAVKDVVDSRNSRSVWSMATQAYSGAHFATFPEKLAEKCIKAGSKKGDVVLDIFSGAGTTCLVADKLGRIGVGTEIGPHYCRQSQIRIFDDAPLLNCAQTA